MANKQFTREDYLALEPVEFRARFRERVHHTLEIQTYAAIHDGKKPGPNAAKTAKELTEIWKEKGLSTELPDYKWAQRIIGYSDALQAGEKVDLSIYAPHAITAKNLAAFENIIKERRSVRHWTKKKVSDELIDKILLAGSWAAHSCNLQSVRFAVLREENVPGLIKGDIPNAPVHILILQDERVYKANPFNPVRNRLLDAGAAGQNIVLAAHAYGLGGVWLTFDDENLEKLYAKLNLDKDIKIVTYVDIGYPDQTPAPVDKLGLDETVLVRI